MSQIAVIAKIPTAPGKRDDFVAAFQAGLDTAQAEEGTRYYILHADQQDENVVWVYEMYEDHAALEAHSSSEAFKALIGQIGPFIGGAPELIRLTPLGGKGC
jgi:quinol monooxygenase YgiN